MHARAVHMPSPRGAGWLLGGARAAGGHSAGSSSVRSVCDCGVTIWRDYGVTKAACARR